MIHFRVPRRLIGERVGALAVVAEVGSTLAFVFIADDDVGRGVAASASSSSAPGRSRDDIHVVLGRAHPPETLVVVAARPTASARIDWAL